MVMKRVALALLVLGISLGGLTACGKRGDPYRPSEIPADSTGNAS